MNDLTHSALETLAASGAFLFGQGGRLIRLRFAGSSGLSEERLLPHRVEGAEALSGNYRYTLDGLSPDIRLELKDLLGQPVEMAIVLPDGGQRLLTGLVTRAEQRGADGGFASYRLTVEPALATLAHRRNSRVFQDKSVPAIVAAILDEHLAANPAFAQSFAHRATLSQGYPPRSYCLQYRESDLAFIERLLAEEGISYRYTHGSDPDTSIRNEDDAASYARGATDHETGAASGANEIPLHTLVLFDANDFLPRNGEGCVRFHRTDGVEVDDAIDAWTGLRQITAGITELASFDYKAVGTYRRSEETRINQGGSGRWLNASLEDYDPQALYYGADPDEIARYAKRRQQAKDLASKTFSGQGSVRRLYPGSWFALAEHPIHDEDAVEEREFLVTGVSFEAENNLTGEARAGLSSLLAGQTNGAGQRGGTGQNRPPYRNTFTAVRRFVPVVPSFSANAHQKPTAGGMTTATVVGPAGEEIFTDEHGRIKIQFHWQRRQDHRPGGADFDDHSSTWVRTAMPSAGASCGTQAIPRIGQEVVVSFIENDIDRPLVTGVVYNGTHRPPAFSGAGSLPANKTLSGVKSKEYKGSRYNELLFDDSTNEVRAKLSSEHGKTQLNQGYLIHPRREGRGEPRGEGFELRTDDSGAMRAAKGLLISAEPRGQAVGNQLDRDMLLGQLQTAEGIAQALSDASHQHGAEITETDQQSQLTRHVENWEKGSSTAPREDTTEGGKAIVALSGPLGIVAGTPESVTIAAGHNLDMVSVKHSNLSVGGKWLARVADSFSLFVQKLGMKLIAAGGDIEVQAQAGEIRISAAKKITISSNTEIIYQAPKLTAIAHGAQIDMGSGAITSQCSGKHEQKAARHEITGPGGGTPKGAFNPGTAGYDQNLVLQWMGTGEPIENRRYRLKFEDGRVVEGTTDDAGRTEHLTSDIGFGRYRVELLPEQPGSMEAPR